MSFGTDILASLSTYRALVTRETHDIIAGRTADQPTGDADCVARLASLLVSSLEEMRVAEEELLRRSDALESQRAEIVERLATGRRPFDVAPCCLVVTNLMGMIADANQEGAELFGVAAERLKRRPLSSLVPLEERAAFRAQLNRVAIAGGVTDWRFKVLRARDMAVPVSAAVRVTTIERGTSSLVWSLRLLDTEASARG